ncbi:hypothetical protein D3C87_1715380 [compost metagenome]
MAVQMDDQMHLLGLESPVPPVGGIARTEITHGDRVRCDTKLRGEPFQKLGLHPESYEPAISDPDVEKRLGFRIERVRRVRRPRHEEFEQTHACRRICDLEQQVSSLRIPVVVMNQTLYIR